MNHHPHPSRSPRSSERGVSLIEFLMVAFIFAIGLLGLFAMQVVGISNGAQSRERGTATLLAHSLLDRIAAEGIVSAGERAASQNGTITPPPSGGTRWVFIDPTGLTPHTSGGAENLYYDLNGNPVASGSSSLVYTLSWQRFAGVASGPSNAIQPFVVNVSWNQTASGAGGTTTVAPRYFSVSRNVRL